MTEPTKTTRARTAAQKASEHAEQAAREGATAAREASGSFRDSVRSRYTAARNSDEVKSIIDGGKEFLSKAEVPALIGVTALNPPLGVGMFAVRKGSQLMARGLREEAARTERVTESDVTNK